MLNQVHVQPIRPARAVMQTRDAIGVLNVLAQNTAEAMTGVLMQALALITAGKANVVQHATAQTADGQIMFVIITAPGMPFTQGPILQIIARAIVRLQQLHAAQEHQHHAAQLHAQLSILLAAVIIPAMKQEHQQTIQTRLVEFVLLHAVVNLAI